jgi:hypothetical protein
MVSGLASSAVDHGFDSKSCQPKDYKIGICCFSANHAALRIKIKHRLARNQNNVSEWSDIPIRGLFLQCNIKIQLLSVLVYSKAGLIIISLKTTLLSPWFSWKIAELALNNNHSLIHSLTNQWYASVDISLACRNHLHGCIISLKVSVKGQKRERSFKCVLGVSILALVSMIFILLYKQKTK